MEKIESEEEYCRGCVIYNGECEIHNDKGECPCTECLVKNMCHEECVAFKKYKLQYEHDNPDYNYG